MKAAFSFRSKRLRYDTLKGQSVMFSALCCLRGELQLQKKKIIFNQQTFSVKTTRIPSYLLRRKGRERERGKKKTKQVCFNKRAELISRSEKNANRSVI